MYIIEETDHGLVNISLDSRLLKDRVIFLNDHIDADLVHRVIQALLYLDSESNDPISIYINSNGGSVTDGFALIDIIKIIRSPVRTVVTGVAASMAALIAMSGEKGHRGALPHSSLMLHDLSTGAGHQDANSFLNYASYITELKENITRHLIAHTKLTRRNVHKFMGSDVWLSASEAQEIGAIDKIISTQKEE